jgi:nicotinate-nucleotide adenylyltransferase
VTGLFGGAFDPPHNGHVALLAAARRAFELERAVVLVVSDPGHKLVHADAETRLGLVRAAFPGEAVELDRHSRTVDLLREQRYADPLFLIGADELADFPSWKEPEVVLQLAEVGVAMRPGYDRGRLDGVLARLEQPERVLFFELDPVDVSSSEIRARVARGEPIESLVPPAVARAIVETGLYRS